MRPLEQRFWEKVDKSSGADSCWLWTASTNGHGYGVIGADGKLQKAHRVSWNLANGPVPEGLCVLHRCDTPPCVNPGHLFLGSHAENMADMNAKGREARGEANGQSKLTATQVVEIREASGTQTAIAARFGVSRRQISCIRAGKYWAHLLTEVSP